MDPVGVSSIAMSAVMGQAQTRQETFQMAALKQQSQADQTIANILDQGVSRAKALTASGTGGILDTYA